MTCNPIKILEDGCLDKKVIELGCKGPEEELYYQFSMANRIGNQTLLSVQATSNSDNIVISDISVDGQTFKCLISGGEIYRNYPIHFVVKTSDGEKRTFSAILPIRPEGVMKVTDQQFTVVTGPQGVEGKAETITIGNVSEGDVASISNQGTDNAAILDFVLPKGDKGDDGKDGINGNIIGFLEEGTPQDTANSDNVLVKNAVSNDIIIIKKEASLYQCSIALDGTKTWTLMVSPFKNDGTEELKVKQINSDDGIIYSNGQGMFILDYTDQKLTIMFSNQGISIYYNNSDIVFSTNNNGTKIFDNYLNKDRASLFMPSIEKKSLVKSYYTSNGLTYKAGDLWLNDDENNLYLELYNGNEWEKINNK